MSNELKPQISLKLLPVEILLQILRFLGSDDTLALLSTTKSMRIPHLLPKIRLSPDSSLQNDIISFNQTGNYNFLLCDEVEPASDYFPFGRRKGLYKQTDRTIISVLPIHFYATAEIFYFEIQVVDASDDAEMRIGLVESKWDLCRPPGSMVDSVGFICRDGHIAVGTGYDDKFMFGDKWGKGDTVGCGLTRDGEVFFTLNGHWIAQSPNNISADFCMNYKKNWYCAFNASAPCKVVAKFADFKYFIGSTVPFLVERKMIPKFDKFCMELRDGISPSDLPVIINSNTIQFSENAASNQSLQSNIPITYLQPGNSARRKGFYYFEIVVEHAPEAQSSFFSIGLSVKPHPLQHHIGWNKDSVGYHSDDGSLFSNSYVGLHQLSGPFSQGSVIGCGYEITTKSVFFTKDGLRLDHATPLTGILYPSVAANSNWRIRFITNTVEEQFIYQEANL